MRPRGFTLVELIMVMGLLTTLLAFTSVNSLSVRRRSDLNAAVDLLLSDIQSQRYKAMTGQGQGGIYFSSGSYTLFPGSTYNGTDPANFTVILETGLQFQNVTLPGTQLVFSRGGGELSGFTPGQDAFVLADPQAGSSKTFTVNRYGIVISVN